MMKQAAIRASILALALTGACPTAAQEIDPPVVRAVLFTSSVCSFCRQIVERDLPPLIQDFGDQLEMLYVDVETEDGRRLYEAAFRTFGVPRGVPLLFVGDHALGGVNIPEQFPELVAAYLSHGGQDWPAIPGLEAYMAAEPVPSPPVSAAAPTPKAPAAMPAPAASGVVRGVLFWMDGCLHCHQVLEEVLPPLEERFGAGLEIWLVEIVTIEDVERLYAISSVYGIPRDRAGVPFLILGDRALYGARRIAAELPGLVEAYLALGGAEFPADPLLAGILAERAPVPIFQLAPAGPIMEQESPSPAAELRPEGFLLAEGVLLMLAAALAYALASLLWARLPVPRPVWTAVLMPSLCLAGLGISSYLAYVEIRAVDAVCGPVGDCNAVQSSAYARLFGVLPVGVLGAVGYALLLAAWTQHRRGRGALKAYAAPACFWMAILGTGFSLYLTYLERFVIRAVCLWCIAAAILMALVLGCSTGMRRETTT